MKFASLLAQFLYNYKQLDLPGIGSFVLDPSVVIEVENSRQNRPAQLEGVSFENNSSVKQSPELIEFIAAQTGKIKALAAADLDSHLEVARQFLNIGKPYLFEGIGSLVKMQAGGFAFTPGQISTDRLRELTPKETVSAVPTEESASDYRSIFYAKKSGTNWKKPAMVLLLLAGIVLAIWGGYAMYKRTIAKKDNPTVETTDTAAAQQASQQASSVSDTGQTAVQPNISTPPVTATAGNFKFVIETAARDRALKRFGKLTTIGVKNVQMETRDSLMFKLFFILPASPADTARMLDSLRRNYTPAGAKAYVE